MDINVHIFVSTAISYDDHFTEMKCIVRMWSDRLSCQNLGSDIMRG